MSVALWPVFQDGHKHILCDEGISVLNASQDLDAMALAAGRMPLSAFGEHADVPDEAVAQHAILAALLAPDSTGVGDEDPEELAESLRAFRRTLQQTARRKTWFNFTIA